MHEMFNAFNLVLFVNYIILLHVLNTVKGPSYLFDISHNTLTKSPWSIRYFVHGGNLDFRARWILYCPMIDSISLLANLNASHLSGCFGSVIDGPGNLGKKRKTITEGTTPLRPIASLMDFLAITSTIFSCTFFRYFCMTLNILQSG